MLYDIKKDLIGVWISHLCQSYSRVGCLVGYRSSTYQEVLLLITHICMLLIAK